MIEAIADKLTTAHANVIRQWDDEIIPLLQEYISIPNKSPMFDPDWKTNGYMDQAMQLILKWCQQQPIAGLKCELLEIEGRTPLLFMEIPGANDDTVLLYGHMDKQPEMRGWWEGYGPWTPVLTDGKLYGRGGADDGYAVFAALTAIATLQAQQIPHSRCVVIIEGSEESGSCDLVHYLKELTPKIGQPSLVITLDSECANYEQMWSTTSLRGLIGGTLTIEVLKNGLHSGYGGGVVPSTQRILRLLLDRIEETKTGDILLPAFNVDIPPDRITQAEQAADIVGDDYYRCISFTGDTQPLTKDVVQLMLNRDWRPNLAVVGAEGLPAIGNAGNVVLPKVKVKLSVRTPPTCDVQQALSELTNALTQDPPFGATIHFEAEETAPGWHSPPLSDWLAQANNHASQWFYNKPAAYMGCGGSIPFMGMLGEMYPKAQFLITGVLGPKSNAHGPNEFLHIDMVKRLTSSVASVVALHHIR